MAAVKELIQAATIARVSRKADGKFLGFLVKSNHTEDYYQITCCKLAGEVHFSCTCKAGQFGKVECCHVKAVKELCAARKELEAERKAAAIAQRDAEHAAWNIEHGYAPDAFSSRINTGKYAIAKADYHPDYNQPAQAAMEQAAQTTIFPKAKKAAVKRAPQFANMPLNGHGFVMMAVPELGGRVVPM